MEALVDEAIEENNKGRMIFRIVDIVVRCCATEIADGVYTVTTKDILGKSRTENAVMSRCILATQLTYAGYSVSTIAQLLGRTPASIRHMRDLDRQYMQTSRAYRIASAEATILCRKETSNF